tara:strand:+ start:862 stop:1185 length:324 start_codon:yes stop_codon:yes gene_type:complete
MSFGNSKDLASDDNFVTLETKVIDGKATFTLDGSEISFGSPLVPYPFGVATTQRNIILDPSLPFIYLPRADFEIFDTLVRTNAGTNYVDLPMPYRVGDLLYFAMSCG